jgi:predicted XRE-type DNA-binding protein
MKTPVFEAGWSKFTDVQKSAEYRGRLEAYEHVLKLIEQFEKPTNQIKQLVKIVETELSKVKPWLGS